MNHNRVRFVWWYPGAPQVTTPGGMVLVLTAAALCSPVSVGLLFWGLVAAFWGLNIAYHYVVRWYDLRQFWAGLEPDWEEKARAQGWEPERALAVYVNLYNSRHYKTPVLRLVPPA